MSLILRQVLPSEAGKRLPAPARKALVEFGMACNTAAAAVNRASLFEDEALVQVQHLAALGDDNPLAEVSDDIAMIAERFREQTLVALARATTAYACYVSHVAGKVAAGEPVPLPGSEVLKPSDVITAAGLYLPPVTFGPEHGNGQVVADQNSEIARAYQVLNDVITYQLQGHDVSIFDDVRLADSHDRPVGIPDVFPFALYDYAATLAWAVGVFTGIDEDV